MSVTQTADQLFEELKQTKRQVVLDGKTYYRVEGDLLLSERRLLEYAVYRANELADERPEDEKQRLVAIVDDDNRIVRWAKGLILTYSVSKAGFTDAQYQTVVRHMRAATAAWEAVCGVNFAHLAAFDDGSQPHTPGPLFIVRGVDTGGEVIAAAFFPNDPPDERRIIIDPVFFAPELEFNPVGVLRHELGHVLGFRHEHIRPDAPPICPSEPLGHTINLTLYDPQSVMHYFCGDVGSKELILTDLDRQAARALYGPPDHEVTYVTP
ncbi:MAG: hypothetical protein R3E79_51850 [Caldilineaceae bacterium]